MHPHRGSHAPLHSVPNQFQTDTALQFFGGLPQVAAPKRTVSYKSQRKLLLS